MLNVTLFFCRTWKIKWMSLRRDDLLWFEIFLLHNLVLINISSTATFTWCTHSYHPVSSTLGKDYPVKDDINIFCHFYFLVPHHSTLALLQLLPRFCGELLLSYVIVRRSIEEYLIYLMPTLFCI